MASQPFSCHAWLVASRKTYASPRDSIFPFTYIEIKASYKYVPAPNKASSNYQKALDLGWPGKNEWEDDLVSKATPKQDKLLNKLILGNQKTYS